MILLPVLLAFQCPDGSPPPCNRPAAARAATLDANRVAVLPFRVTSADTSLGSGFAELVAAEFGAETGPRAVHMGSALRAWRRAGGTPTMPLAQAEAIRAARELGAGRLVEGSIVGLGARLTITTSVLSVGDGRVQRAPQVSGPADSLDVLLRRVVTGLVGLMGGELRANDRGQTTDSPDALRAYMAALAAWRRGDLRLSAREAERAAEIDSLFAQPVFLRYRIETWNIGPQGRQWALRAVALKHRLSPDDRALLHAQLGERFPQPRPAAQNLADRERAAERLPDSPEALYLLGDYLYHYGGALDAQNRFERARALLERSYDLDSQSTVLLHLVEFATLAADTAAARRLRPVLEARMTDSYPPKSMIWALAARTGDQAWLQQLRRQMTTEDLANATGVGFVMHVGLDQIEDIRRRLPAEAAGSRLNAAGATMLAATVHGHPSLARRLQDSLGAAGLPYLAVETALFSDGDSAHGADVARRLATGALTDTSRVAACVSALWHQLTLANDTANLDAIVARHASCGQLLRLLRLRSARDPGFHAELARTDSIIRTRQGPASFAGFEHLLLSRLWLETGDTARALSALRARPHGFGFALHDAAAAREEGRLALALGDTASARRAWSRYLDLRRDPEPSLIAQRDSIRAALAALP